MILGPRRAIFSIPLNTDLTSVQLKTRLMMRTGIFRDIEIKALPNTFRATPFESLKISVARIRKLRVLTETNPSLSKKHQKDEYLSLQVIKKLSRSLNTLLFRVLPWRIHTNGQQLTCYLRKKSLVQWTLVIKNSERTMGLYLM